MNLSGLPTICAADPQHLDGKRSNCVTATLVYYLCVVLLLLAMGAAWFANLFALPGNWLIVGLAALFAFFFPVSTGRGVHWVTVGVGVALALVGEVIELNAGAAGARKSGASRRAMLLALAGTMVGSLLGAFAAIPIPVVGPILGAVGGGALGAFAGAYAGETALGRSAEQSLAAGKGALVGRLLGTAGKLLIGVVLFVVIAVDALI
jgi:uncharacterized protein